ncbi:MAG: twin-arginine translocase subunit TatC, partial [Butyricimonas faecalis]
VVGYGYIMFMVGVLISYFLIFPLTFRFLGTYQVSDQVENMISLQSYISTLLMMCLAMGIVFEIPILSWLFAKLGFISADFMRRYRRHAVVIILIVAAIITPTSDVFTLLLVSLPMWLLYEVSILIVKSRFEVKEGVINPDNIYLLFENHFILLHVIACKSIEL